jgi:predicted amidophosphoribosyltransferase
LHEAPLSPTVGDRACYREYCPDCDAQVTIADEKCPDCGRPFVEE